jgi:DHA1 family bicyclomycin/chloramphenicol resistance-like MFS transporter
LLSVKYGWLGFGFLVACLLLLMATWGFIPPNATALALWDQAAVAGSAAAVTGSFQFGIAAIAAPLVGAGGAHDAQAFAIAMPVFGMAGMLAATVAARPLRRA